MKRLLRTPFFIRLRNWEYWPSSVVYAPIFPYWLWLSLKARSFYFLTAANPRIRNGGFIMESKKDVYDLLPVHVYPKTFLLDNAGPPEAAIDIISSARLSLPIICKPDIGERGLGVKKIKTIDELQQYVATIPVPFLMQEFVPYDNEVGIFYCRIPGTEEGYISGIVNKEPVAITGDGVSTIADLVRNNDRYLLQWKQITAIYNQRLNDVPASGERIELIPYGNHSRGSKFTDETGRVTRELNDTIHRICSQIPEFYYGRLDIRFESWEALERGEDLAIIEVNGSGSEPTHIYDPKHSILFAWREILKHWKILYRISKANNKRGVPYTTLAAGLQDRSAFMNIDRLLSAQTW